MEDEEGIQIELKKGDTELKVTMGSEITSNKIEAVKEMISPFAPSSGSPSKEENEKIEKNKQKKRRNKNSLFYRLKVLIANVFRYGQVFTSRKVREAFEEIFGESINASTCSTYLRRMEREGFLTVKSEGRIIEYHLSENKVDLPSLDELGNRKRKGKEAAIVKNGG